MPEELDEPEDIMLGAPVTTPFEDREAERAKLDSGEYTPLVTRQEGLGYQDRVFEARGMIGTLDTRKAILAGPFIRSSGSVPFSCVIWVPPDRSKVAINEVSIHYDRDDNLGMKLHTGDYFDGAFQDPERYEERIHNEWHRRWDIYKRSVICEINCGRILNCRRFGASKVDEGLKGIFWDTDEARMIYDALTERIWEAGGYV